MLDRRQFLLLSVSAAAVATAVGARASRDRITASTYWSPVLGRAMPYLTHSAEGAGDDAPVLYLLHGHGGGEWDWVRAGGAIETVDQMVEARMLPPLHVVLPGVGNSWYVDGPAPHGPVATTLLDGLMPVVEQALAPEAAWRGVIGLSMGGFGALHLGLQQPKRWRFIGALSPAIFTPGSQFPGFQLQLFSGAFGDPFDRARFAAANPFNRVPALARAEERPELYLSCGIEDFFGLAVGTRAFGEALADAAVPATVLIKSGRHDWAYWRAELPEALAALGSTVS